jgi:phosphoribosylformylglycinamidine cyclo-ligase
MPMVQEKIFIKPTCIEGNRRCFCLKGIAQDALIMNIWRFAVCWRNKYVVFYHRKKIKNLIPAEVLSAIINGTEELIAELGTGVVHSHWRWKLVDVGDLVRIIVDSTVTARMKRDDVIDNANKSWWCNYRTRFDQANYEKSYNGGMGSVMV